MCDEDRIIAVFIFFHRGNMDSIQIQCETKKMSGKALALDDRIRVMIYSDWRTRKI